MRPSSSLIIASLLGVSLTATPVAYGQDAAEATAAAEELKDAVVDAYRRDLLEVAYSAASAMPHMPHIKERSRNQELVVSTCLELELPVLAKTYNEGIDNWRKGVGYGDLAFFAARAEMPALAEEYIALAEEVAAYHTEHDEEFQAWRRDRILMKVARAHEWLGRTDMAETLEAGVEESEAGAVDIVRAMMLDEEELDAELERLEGLVQTGNLDQALGALVSATELFDRFYDNEEARGRASALVTDTYGKLPRAAHIEIVEKLAEAAISHSDLESALAYVDEVDALVTDAQWLPEDEVQLRARTGALRFRAGDEEGGRLRLSSAMELFDEKRDEIVDIWRASALRPLAEAWHSIGNRSATLMTFKMAVSEAVVNQNSRPRTDDLVAICVSLARLGVEPDDALWKQIRSARDGLGDPW